MAKQIPVEKRSNVLVALAICAVAVTRLLFRSHLLYDIDSVNFALGMRRFDPAGHQPHPPGYFLYVCLGRLVSRLISDPNAALVAISITASCGAAWMIYLLAREWFSAFTARISVLLFLFSPLCWFHGIVALTYIVEAFFAALIGYLSWRVYRGQTSLAIPAAIAFGLAVGFRPSSALLLGPLWLFPLFSVPGSRRWAALLAAAGVIFLWCVPMTAAAGGVRAYMEAFRHLWFTVPGNRTILSSGWLGVARILTIGFIMALTFGSASVLAFIPVPRDSSRRVGLRGAGYRAFVIAWVAPGLLFFSFVFLNYVNSGYLLLISPPLFAILADRIARFTAIHRDTLWLRIVIVLGIAVNCSIFVWAPLYCSYKTVRGFENDMTAIAHDVRSTFRPDETVIIGFDSHFLGYRHAGFYLPEFQVIQYPEVRYSDGNRVFVLHNRDTLLTREVSVGAAQRLVFFPLPEGKEYDAYVREIVDKLPEGAISRVSAGRRKVLVGPVSLLPVLFPATARSVTDGRVDSTMKEH